MSDTHNDDLIILAKNQLPADATWLFPEYEFESMNLKDYQGVITERILKRGSWRQIQWLFLTFGEIGVENWVLNHGFRLLSKRSIALWRPALGIEEFKVPSWTFTAKEMELW
jgi:hypothetical protein